MKPLRDAIADYLALRRSLGFKLRATAAHLIDFVSFLEQKAAPYITTALAMEWAMQHVDHQPCTWAQRLGFVRVFARHWSATDSRTEIPPAGLLPFRGKRTRPYLYTEQEVQRLLVAAKHLSPSSGLRPWTYHCLFGLLAVSGLRISEAIKLDRQDVDFNQGLLTIRQTKFNKSRLIPLHVSTRDVLAEYAQRRDRLVPTQSSPLLSAQRSWPMPGKLQRAPNLLCSFASDWLARSSRSYRTASPRFSAECRGQENAE
jgi:integrase/recombinase XerD